MAAIVNAFRGSPAEATLKQRLKDGTVPLDPRKETPAIQLWEQHMKEKAAYAPFHERFPGEAWGKHLRKLQKDVTEANNLIAFKGSNAEKSLVEALKTETLPVDLEKKIKPMKYWEDHLKGKIEFAPFHQDYPGAAWGQHLRTLQKQTKEGPRRLPDWRGEKLPAKKFLKKLLRQLEAIGDLEADVDAETFFKEYLADEERFSPFHEDYERIREKFPGWLKTAVTEVLTKRVKATEDLEAFLHDREIYPERMVDDAGEVVWDRSLTQEYARDAVISGRYPGTDPKEIYDELVATHDQVREENVGADRFRKFLLQMMKTDKFNNYIDAIHEG